MTAPTGPRSPDHGGVEIERPKLGYRPSLDGLRAVAIGLVLIEHSGIGLFNGGRDGVVVFFVLSGFLITKLMLEEWDSTDALDLRAFYGRRTVRIMPAPMIMLVGLALFATTIVQDPEPVTGLLKEIVWSGTYLYNMVPFLGTYVSDFFTRPEGYETNWLAHTWSLATEEQFYLLWPGLFLLLRLPKRRPDAVIKSALAFAGFCLVARLVLYAAGVPDIVSISLFTFDAFAIGIALAFALHYRVSGRLEAFLADVRVFFVAAAVLAVDLIDPLGQHLEPHHGETPWQPYFSFGAETAQPYLYFGYVSLATAAIIGHLMVNAGSYANRLLSWGLFVWIGKLSYSLYLWHVPVQVFFSRDRFPDMSLPMLILVEQVLTLAFAAASYYWIEKPFSRLRKHFVVK